MALNYGKGKNDLDYDLDKDSDCAGDLVCGKDNCPWPAKRRMDCCKEKDCNPSKNDWHCCSASKPCVNGQGDCDKDSDCYGNLVCGDNNCGRGKLDCCMWPPGPVMITK